MLKILFLADPNLTHDIRWMEAMKEISEQFLVYRKHHTENPNIKFARTLRAIDDFSIVRPLKTLRSLWLIVRIIRKFKIDIFYIFYVEPNVLWSIVKLFVKVKIVATTRGTDILKTIPDHFNSTALQNVYVKKLYKMAFRKVDAVICTSKKQKQHVKDFFCHSNVHVVRTGVMITSIVDFSRLPHQLVGKKYLFFPRNMKPIYNHEFAIDSINLLPKDILDDYLFVFVNKDGQNREYIGKIESMIKDSPANILFLNTLNKDEMASTYIQCRAVVNTPLSDGSPVSAMEAMLYKVPVIMPNLEYDSEVFSQAVFYRKDDKKDLSSVIARLVNNEIIPNTEAAYRQVCKYGNRETEMNKLKELILSL